MANNGAQQLTTTEAEVYADPDGCTSFQVKVLASAAANALIQVDTLHGSEWFEIEPGDTVIFRLMHLGIRKIRGKAASGTVDILKGVVAKTQPE